MGEHEGWGRRRFLGAVATGAAVVSVGGASASASASAAPDRRGPRPPRSAARPLLLGTYTTGDGAGTGITYGTYDPVTGAITATGVLAVDNPSWLALAPDGGTLYTVDEQDDGSVTAIALDPGGAPRIINSQPTGGDGPTHVSVHPSGRYVLSANYGSGSVAVHPVAPDGSLGARTDLVQHSSPAPGPNQTGPHAHQVITSPDGGHVLAVDLGNDTVYTYALDLAAGTLAQVSYATLPPGTGPRHLTFHPGGTYAYLANEVGNNVAVCAYDIASGTLTPAAAQSPGTGSGVNYPAEFLVDARGGMAYLANRGWNTIARFVIGDGGASLQLLDSTPVGGDFPRNIAFDPAQGLLFAGNQRSSTVTAFTVDPDTGALTASGAPFGAPIPVSVLPL